MELDVQSSVEASRGTVTVKGEVDVSNAAQVRDALDALLSDSAITLITVDLKDVPYIDSTGIGVLVGGAGRAKEAGKTLSATNVSPNVARILGMLGVEDIIGA